MKLTRLAVSGAIVGAGLVAGVAIASAFPTGAPHPAGIDDTTGAEEAAPFSDVVIATSESGIGTLRIVEGTEPDTRCLTVTHPDNAIGFSCFDSKVADNGTAYMYFRRRPSDPGFLVGILDKNASFSASVGDRTVTADDNGIWWTQVGDHDTTFVLNMATGPVEFTIEPVPKPDE
jgi:hypothetical protein